MSGNDRVLLDRRLATRHRAQAPDLSLDEFFNVFVAELLTQDYQLPGPEYLQYGVVDGAQDCGIDALYTFVNGMLVTDDFQRFSVPQQPDIDLFIVQCKTGSTFTESPIEKLVTHVPQLFELDRSEAGLAKICNIALLAESRRFLDTYASLANKRPKLKVHLVYACRGDEPSAGVVAKAEIARAAVLSVLREAEVEIGLMGCRELVDLSRRPARIDRILQASDTPMASDTGDGYVCLVRLTDYFQLIRDPATGRLDAALFEANVREHEGETDVNSEILESLRDSGGNFDFWWLNNGVTIVAEDVSAMGKRLTLISPQIVNGLQTSTEIFKYFSNIGGQDDRLLLVRVVRAADGALRDRIVKATNSQNELPLSALRATEPFQRDLEEFLEARGYYYDRKRNYSRTRGYDDKRVVSMAFAGHAVASILLQRPDVCRGLGAGLLNDDDWYRKTFDRERPLTSYLNCIWLLRKVQSAILDDQRVKGTKVEDWQYHVAMAAAMMMTRKERPSATDLAGMDVRLLVPERVSEIMDIVTVEYQQAIPANARWSFTDLSASERVATGIRSRVASLLRSVHWREWPNGPVSPEFALRSSDVFYKRVTGGG